MTTINTVKAGQKIDLTKTNPGLNKLMVGLGWDTNAFGGASIDLDASVSMLNAAGKLGQTGDFVFFNNLTSPDGSVKHSGDNLTGEGEGDDEKVYVTLSEVPAEVEKLTFAVTIYQGKERNQTFGKIENAFVRVVNEETGAEIVHFDLDEDFSIETTMILGEIYRNNGEWKFAAIGQGFEGGINEIVARYQ